MADKKQKDPSKKSSKKKFRKRVEDKLAASLGEFRLIIGEKKFDREIRKIAEKLGGLVAEALPKKLKQVKTHKKEKV